MEHVAIEDLEPEPADGGGTKWSLTEPLRADHVAINRYVLAPGERFSGAVHAHADQEEVFVVLEGEATFETRDGEVAVDEREAVRFAPGEFQSGGNDGDERVVALALGAPRGGVDVRISRIVTADDGDVTCPDCGADEMRIAPEEGAELVCPECGTELEGEDDE